MALQWMILGLVATVEAAIVLLLSVPVPSPVRKQLLKLVRPLLQPALAVIPFALFQLLEVYWKYEHRIRCHEGICTAKERDHFEKSMFKGQRNALLGVAAAFFYWLLYRLVQVHTEITRLEDEVKKLQKTE